MQTETITDYLARGGTVTRCPPQPAMGDLPGLYGVQKEQARAAAAAGSRASAAKYGGRATLWLLQLRKGKSYSEIAEMFNVPRIRVRDALNRILKMERRND